MRIPTENFIDVTLAIEDTYGDDNHDDHNDHQVIKHNLAIKHYPVIKSYSWIGPGIKCYLVIKSLLCSEKGYLLINGIL